MPGPTEQSITWVAEFRDKFSEPVSRLKDKAAEAWRDISESFARGASGIAEAEEAISGFQLTLPGIEVPPIGGIGVELPVGGGIDATNALLNLIADTLLAGFDRLIETAGVFESVIREGFGALVSVTESLLTPAHLKIMFDKILAFGASLPEAALKIIKGAMVGLEEAVHSVGEGQQRTTEAIESMTREELMEALREGLGAKEAEEIVGEVAGVGEVKGAGGFLSMISSLMEGVTGAFEDFASGAIGTIGTAATGAFAALVPLRLLMRAVERLLSPMADMASELFDVLLEPFIGLSELLSTTLIPVFEALQAVLGVVYEILAPIVEAVTSSLLTVLEPLAEIVSTILEPIGSILGSLVRVILVPLVMAFEALGFALRLLMIPLRIIMIPFEILANLLEQAAGFMEPLLDVFSVFEEMLEPIMDAIDELVNSFGEIFGAVLEPFAELFGKVLAPAFKIFGAMVQMVVRPLRMLGKVFGGLAEAVGDLMEHALEPLIDFFEKLTYAIDESMTAIIDALQSIPLIGWLFGGREGEGAEEGMFPEAPTEVAIELPPLPSPLPEPIAVAPPVPEIVPAPAPTGTALPKLVEELITPALAAVEPEEAKKLEVTEEQTEQMKILANFAQAQLEETRLNRLDPDDWTEMQPILVRIASFGVA